MRLIRFLLDPSVVPGLLVGTGLTALVAAFFIQHVLGAPPCYLCIWERWPFVALVALGAAAYAAPPQHPLRRAVFGLAALVAAGSAVLAAYHVGVEQHWWAGTAACAPEDGADDLDALRRLLTETEVVRCDEVNWSLAGISLAGFNVLLSSALFLYCLAAAMTGPASRRVPA